MENLWELLNLTTTYTQVPLSDRPLAGAEEFKPARHFFTTPSVNYASRRSFAAPFPFRGRQAQVVLQVMSLPWIVLN